MRVALAVALILALVMGVVIVYAFVAGDFAAEGAKLAAMPWGVVSLVDVYIGFLLFCGWVLFREKSVGVALVWAVAILILGNLLSALYVVFALRASRGDWKRFWLGARA